MKIPGTKTSMGVVIASICLAVTLSLADRAASQETAAANQPEIRFLGLQLSSALLPGTQSLRVNTGVAAEVAYVNINNSDIFRSPLYVALAFGLKPKGTRIFGFGEISYLSMNLKEHSAGALHGSVDITGEDGGPICFRGGFALYLADVGRSRLIPSLGVIGQVGTRQYKLNTFTYSTNSLGPMAALDFRLRNSVTSSQFFALHGEIQCNLSLSNHYPDMITVAVGLRYFSQWHGGR